MDTLDGLKLWALQYGDGSYYGINHHYPQIFHSIGAAKGVMTKHNRQDPAWRGKEITRVVNLEVREVE